MSAEPVQRRANIAAQESERTLDEGVKQTQRAAEQLGEKIKENAKSLWHSAEAGLASIKDTLKNARVRDYIYHLGAAVIAGTLLHAVVNVVGTGNLTTAQYLSKLYFEHYQPWVLTFGLGALSMATHHLSPANQYAWGLVALTMVPAVVGMVNFPGLSALHKMAIEIPFNARSMIGLAGLVPLSNYIANKLRKW